MIVDSLFENIKRGKKGLNVGLSTGLDKIDKVTFGVQRRWMTTIFGDSGCGKSSLCLYTAVYQPFQQMMKSEGKINAHWLLFSMEMSAEVLLAKLLSTYIYDEYNTIISYDKILSLQETITDAEYNLVLKARPWLDALEEHCEIIDKPVTAKALYGICKEWSRKFGNYVEVTKTDDFLKENYVTNDPQQYLIVMVDHIKLLSINTGHTSKQEIDEACEYLMHFRNKCGFTIYIVQQANRNFRNMERRNAGYQYLQLDDKHIQIWFTIDKYNYYYKIIFVIFFTAIIVINFVPKLKQTKL